MRSPKGVVAMFEVVVRWFELFEGGFGVRFGAEMDVENLRVRITRLTQLGPTFCTFESFHS